MRLYEIPENRIVVRSGRGVQTIDVEHHHGWFMVVHGIGSHALGTLSVSGPFHNTDPRFALIGDHSPLVSQ